MHFIGFPARAMAIPDDSGCEVLTSVEGPVSLFTVIGLLAMWSDLNLYVLAS
jgi:hypothetical protein